MWLHDNFHKLKLMVKFGVNVNIHSCFPFPMASTKNVSESYFLVTDTAICQSMVICNCQPATSGGWHVVAGDLHGRSLSVNSHQLLTAQPSKLQKQSSFTFKVTVALIEMCWLQQ